MKSDTYITLNEFNIQQDQTTGAKHGTKDWCQRLLTKLGMIRSMAQPPTMKGQNQLFQCEGTEPTFPINLLNLSSGLPYDEKCLSPSFSFCWHPTTYSVAGLQTVIMNYGLQMPPSLGPISHEYCPLEKLHLEMLTEGLQYLLMIFNLKNI